MLKNVTVSMCFVLSIFMLSFTPTMTAEYRWLDFIRQPVNAWWDVARSGFNHGIRFGRPSEYREWRRSHRKHKPYFRPSKPMIDEDVTYGNDLNDLDERSARDDFQQYPD
nr:PREDICTED: uncharacterized protein LOC109034191 isoform X1 [Bemisia tabaci]